MEKDLKQVTVGFYLKGNPFMQSKIINVESLDDAERIISEQVHNLDRIEYILYLRTLE